MLHLHGEEVGVGLGMDISGNKKTAYGPFWLVAYGRGGIVGWSDYSFLNGQAVG